MDVVVALKPTLRGRHVDLEGFDDAIEALAKLADELGVVPLVAYFDNRPVPKGFRGSPDDLLELLGAFDTWFTATEGLASVEPLIAALTRDARVQRRFRRHPDLLSQLRRLAAYLRRAKKARARFHFDVY